MAKNDKQMRYIGARLDVVVIGDQRVHVATVPGGARLACLRQLGSAAAWPWANFKKAAKRYGRKQDVLQVCCDIDGEPCYEWFADDRFLLDWLSAISGKPEKQARADMVRHCLDVYEKCLEVLELRGGDMPFGYAPQDLDGGEGDL